MSETPMDLDVELRLHDALDWLIHLHYGISKGGDNCPITDEEWKDAINQGCMALEEYDRQRHPTRGGGEVSETISDDRLECPNCGYIDPDSWELRDSDGNEATNCPRCDQLNGYRTEVTRTFTAWKLRTTDRPAKEVEK